MRHQFYLFVLRTYNKNGCSVKANHYLRKASGLNTGSHANRTNMSLERFNIGQNHSQGV